MFPRFVLAFVFAIPPFVGLVAQSLATEQMYTVVVRMSSSVSGVAQLFLDTGNGFSEEQSVAVPQQSSDEARELRFQLGAGRYRQLRLDPSGAGTYAIERVTLVDPTGQVSATIPLEELTLAYGLRVVERRADKLVVACPPGANDPQLVYAPDAPLSVTLQTRSLAGLMRWFGLYVAVGFALIWVAQLAFGRMAPRVSRAFETVAHAGQTHPQIAIIICALMATLVAMYPTLLLGRSLVSPNTGGPAMLYDGPPFTAESSDLAVEDVRNSDVGATMWVFAPYSAVQRNALKRGELPLWNRYNGAGRPLWGQGQSFVLDPLHWLTFLGPDIAPGWDLKFAAHRFVLAWGVGVAAFVAIGAWAPAAIAAIATPFLGLFVFRVSHPAVFALTYGPWVLVGWFLLARAATRLEQARAALMLSVASALLLVASPPKEGAVMLLAVEAAGCLTILLSVRPFVTLTRRLLVAAIAGLAATLVTTPHWLLFLQTLRASATPYDTPRAFFATQHFALGLVLGPLASGMPLPALHPLALPLLVAVALSPFVLLRHRGIAACALVAAVMIGMAFGMIPEAWLVRVPLLANIHTIHATFLSMSLVLLLVCSAAGADVLLRGSRTKVLLVTLGTLAAGAWIFDTAGSAAGLGQFEGWLVLLSMSGAALIPFAYVDVTRSFPRILPLAAAAALTAALVLPSGQHVEAAVGPIDRILLQPRARTPLEARSAAVEAIHAATTEPMRVTGIGYVLLQGTQGLYDLEGIGGADSLFSREIDELLTGTGRPAPEAWLRMFTRDTLAADAPLLDMLNVGYFLARYDQADGLGPTESMHRPDVLRAIRRPSAWPRAFFVDHVGTHTGAMDLLSQVRHTQQPVASLLASDTVAAQLTRTIPRGVGDVVRADQYSLRTNTTSFHVRAPRAGVVVLSEADVPKDFIATLNGQFVPYLRVNHAFKGVVIPSAGDWQVRFEYRPHGWTVALIAALIGAVILVALGVQSVRDGR